MRVRGGQTGTVRYYVNFDGAVEQNKIRYRFFKIDMRSPARRSGSGKYGILTKMIFKIFAFSNCMRTPTRRGGLKEYYWWYGIF